MALTVWWNLLLALSDRYSKIVVRIEASGVSRFNDKRFILQYFVCRLMMGGILQAAQL